MDRLQTNLLPREGERATIERHRQAGRPSGVICSLATGRHRELLAESAPTLAAYAQRHGWSLVLSCETLGDRPASWTKLILIQELLPKFDFVFWVDADAIIIDIERDILAEIGEGADIWFANHTQERNPDNSVPNAGVFLARSTPFSSDLLAAMWANEQFIHHNWWENAALLDLLGYSLERPYPKFRESGWDARVGELDLAWNSVPGYCESPRPAINHHARSDHDDFNLRLGAMAADRMAAMEKFRAAFESVRSPSSAGVDGGQRRTHDFDGLALGNDPSVAELMAIVDRLDADNEAQRLRLIEVLDLLEDSVTDLVTEQRRAGELAAQLSESQRHHEIEVERLGAELVALRNTKLFRLARPFRNLYGRLLRRRRG